MNLKRAIVRSVAAVSAGALPIILSAQPAPAVEYYERFRAFEHTFTNFENKRVTCTVSGGASLFRESGNQPFFAGAQTSVFSDEGGGQCDAFVAVSTTYRDDRGRVRHGGADGINEVGWFADGVASGYVAEHLIFFFDCESNCEVSFATQPK